MPDYGQVDIVFLSSPVRYQLPTWFSSGSTLHALRTFEHPRWEDFDYESLSKKRNRFYWLGNGWTVAERDGIEGERKSSFSGDELFFEPLLYTQALGISMR